MDSIDNKGTAFSCPFIVAFELFIFYLPFMMDLLEKTTNRILNETKRRLECLLSLCESPIEKTFLANFLAYYIRPATAISTHDLVFIFGNCINDTNTPVSHTNFPQGPVSLGRHVKLYEPGIYCCGARLINSEMFINPITMTDIEILPQYKIITENRTYRVDFCIFYLKNSGVQDFKLVIECDGHDFHERNKEQATRDKQKDRDLLSHGYAVLRYTGSEIHLNRCFTDFIYIIKQIESIVFREERLDETDICEKLRREFEKEESKRPHWEYAKY